MIKILDFSDKLFHEISHHDNPATNHIVNDYPKKERSIMIVKSDARHQVGSPGYKVLDLFNPTNKYDAVLGLGVFYTLENAKLFAEKYRGEIND